jgi:phosphohistidine phosphatase
VADALNRLGIRPKLVFTSPLVRSRQTAEILSERIKHAPEPVETQALAPGAGWAQLKREIARHGAVLAGRKAATTLIVIVGHQPGLSEMIIEALSGSPADFRFQKSACIGLEWEDDKPAGTPALFLALEPETARLVAKL